MWCGGLYHKDLLSMPAPTTLLSTMSLTLKKLYHTLHFIYCVCVGARVQESAPSFHCVGPGHGTWVSKLASKHLYPAWHLDTRDSTTIKSHRLYTTYFQSVHTIYPPSLHISSFVAVQLYPSCSSPSLFLDFCPQPTQTYSSYDQQRAPAEFTSCGFSLCSKGKKKYKEASRVCLWDLVLCTLCESFQAHRILGQPADTRDLQPNPHFRLPVPPFSLPSEGT